MVLDRNRRNCVCTEAYSQNQAQRTVSAGNIEKCRVRSVGVCSRQVLCYSLPLVHHRILMSAGNRRVEENAMWRQRRAQLTGAQLSVLFGLCFSAKL